jgi:hypothetical protein
VALMIDEFASEEDLPICNPDLPLPEKFFTVYLARLLCILRGGEHIKSIRRTPISVLETFVNSLKDGTALFQIGDR